MADADTDVKVESKASAEDQKRAEKLGWIPPTRFRGDPERFIDAEEYIRRGEEMLPLVKAENRKLESHIGELTGKLSTLEAALQKSNTLNAAATDEKKDDKGDKGDGAKQPPAFVPPSDLVEWQKDNPWFGKDRRKTSLALGIAQELREGGETRQGAAFYELVSAEMDKMFPPADPPQSKVEGSRNGADVGTGSKGKKSYASLPADAKAACEADARKFVGKDKRYKTNAEWQNRYAELYYANE